MHIVNLNFSRLLLPLEIQCLCSLMTALINMNRFALVMSTWPKSQDSGELGLIHFCYDQLFETEFWADFKLNVQRHLQVRDLHVLAHSMHGECKMHVFFEIVRSNSQLIPSGKQHVLPCKLD